MDCFTNGSPMGKRCYEEILQTMAEGVVFVDTERKIKYCNRAFLKYVNATKQDVIGKSCSNFIECTSFANDFEEAILLPNQKCTIKKSDNTVMTVLRNGRVVKDDEGKVVGAVATILDISDLERKEFQITELEQEIETKKCCRRIIGHGKKMTDVFEKIRLSAASEATISITGETGTGKELVADAIHSSSRRADGPLIKLNCSAIPENLLESELFGHVKGAFTGAINDKPGKFELAEGGTLFLDEIGEVSPLIQVKLLRFLQEKTFERVGGSRSYKADVRIITATNKDLRKLVNKGEFRDDLFYRLKVFPIHLPPLRERKEDLGSLIDYFIKKFNESTGKSIKGLSHEAAVMLMDYCWPGNVRELENAIEHAFVTCQTDTIEVFDLPIEIRRVEMRDGICSTSINSFEAMPQSLAPMKKSTTLKRDDIIEALHSANWNKSEAARLLGIDRSTLWRKMKKLGL